MPKIDVTFVEPNAIDVNFTEIESEVSFSEVTSEASYIDLRASIKLDLTSRNQYIRDDFFGTTDTVIFQSDKAEYDPISFSDDLGFLTQKELPEVVSIGDFADQTVAFDRIFTDAYSLNDSFSYTFIIGNGSVLNSSALNTFALNT